jgi:hypothetical protein
MQAIFGEDWTYTMGETLGRQVFYPRLGAEGDYFQSPAATNAPQ